jgi:hypothetical protein
MLFKELSGTGGRDKKGVKTSGATIAMTRPSKHSTRIEAKKTFAGLTLARRSPSKLAATPPATASFKLLAA